MRVSIQCTLIQCFTCEPHFVWYLPFLDVRNSLAIRKFTHRRVSLELYVPPFPSLWEISWKISLKALFLMFNCTRLMMNLRFFSLDKTETILFPSDGSDFHSHWRKYVNTIYYDTHYRRYRMRSFMYQAISHILQDTVHLRCVSLIHIGFHQ